MLYLILAAAVCLLDQTVKYWIVDVMQLELGDTVPVLDKIIHLTRVHNEGGGWSILSDYTWLLTVISCAAIAAITVMLFLKSIKKDEKILLAFIMGGALGNVIDRLALQYVVDMFEFEFISFPVFNVADMFISIPGILLCLLLIRDMVREEREKKTSRVAGMPEIERLKKNLSAGAEQEESGECAKAEDGGDGVDEGDNL